MNKYEQLIEHIINDETDKARELDRDGGAGDHGSAGIGGRSIDGSAGKLSFREANPKQHERTHNCGRYGSHDVDLLEMPLQGSDNLINSKVLSLFYSR